MPPPTDVSDERGSVHRLLLHETHDAHTLYRVELETCDERESVLALTYEGKRIELESAVLVAVFERLAKEKDPTVVADGEVLTLGGGAVLRRLRHLARYDVIARDYLVLERPGRVALVELATAITAALVHLAEAAGAGRDEA